MASCESKTPYTMKAAKKAAKKATGTAGRKIYWYCCTVCGKYHLTKKEPRQFQRLVHQRQVLAKKRRDSGVYRKVK